MNNKMITTTHLSTITLNGNGLNASFKRHKVTKWIRKQDPYICCLLEIHFRLKDIHRLKVKGWKKMFYENGSKQESWVLFKYKQIFIPDKRL